MRLILKKYRREEIISGIYYAIRLIRHLDSISSPANFLSQLPLSSSEKEITENIIKDIEKTMGRKINSLTNTEANRHIVQLSKLADENSNNAFGQNIERGQELLKQLKQQVPIN